jgi:GalNAc-alpha-(1->4)-GalNAc-alpha-(1->3)-diNAcBac-PP-undecaprenol alpha-1,4-N-acetyl-D-galactosaminyltransferase
VSHACNRPHCDTSPLAAQRLGSQIVPMAPLPVGLPDTRRRQIKSPPSARVALVVSSLDAGGAERVISIMANHWAERGWDVAVITIGSAARDFYALDPRVTRTALGADDCSDGIREAIANNAHRIKRLRAAIRDANPDAVISFLTSTNVLALIAGTLARVPVIVSERIDPTEEPAPTAWKALRRVAYPRAHAVVVQTPEVRAWAEAFPTRDG